MSAGRAAIFGCLLLGHLKMAGAAEFTPDPAQWRPMIISNLQTVTRDNATFADIWPDLIAANNRVYANKGDRRYTDGNAPVTEAHFVIWTPSKSVTFSVLNSYAGCSIFREEKSAGVIVKKCPGRIAVYQGVTVQIKDAGQYCYVEQAAVSPLSSSDTSSNGAFVSYDVPTKTLRTGVLINHETVSGCSVKIPLYPSQ